MLRRLLGLGAARPAPAPPATQPRAPKGTAKAPATPEAPIVVHHEGRAIAVRVRRSGRARRVGLRVRAATREAVLTLPTRAGRAAAEAFARSQAGWIAARLDRLAPPVPLLPGAEVPLRGVPHRLVHAPQGRGARAEVGEDGPRLVVGGHAAGVPARALAFLKREARRDLAAHEVAHRVEMNHSPRYWRVLRSLPVEVDAAEAWLKREGASLHRYGGAAPSDEADATVLAP